MRSTFTRSAATAAAILFVLPLAACATAAPPEDAGSAVETPAPTATANDAAADESAADETATSETMTAEPEAEDAAATEPSADLGEDFAHVPLPAGHTVIESEGGDSGDGTAAAIHVPGAWEETAGFYRDGLPAAGWTIDDEQAADDGTGVTFTTSRDSTQGTFDVADDDGDTAVTVTLAQADDSTYATEVCTDHSEHRLAPELPDGFPDGECIPLYSPSERVTGADHGDGMWVLEYVTNGDLADVTRAIEEEIDAEGWTIANESVEGMHTVYELEKRRRSLVVVIAPERTDDEFTSIHYTMRTF